MPKIILAFDKFKGAASSTQVAEAAHAAIKAIDPQAQVVDVAVADGGEGTVAALAHAMSHAERVTCKVSPPVHTLHSVQATYMLDQVQKMAIMELSAASGLALLKPQELDVMNASTFGTGEMIADAVKRGCRHIVLGIGGSATNDCATGLLTALGFQFLDSTRHPLYPCGANLGNIAHIDDSKVSKAVRETKFTLITDVDNPLCGRCGAANVFAAQKGANPAQIKLLDKGAQHFAKLLPQGIAERCGAGAAGGSGAGMMGFLNAELKPGVDAVLQFLHFDDIIADADLIFTGEGCIDVQTAMGKTPCGVLRAGHRQGIPVIAIAGAIAQDLDTDNLGFDAVFPIVQRPMTLKEALDAHTCLDGVKRTITQIYRLFLLNKNTRL